MKRISFYGAAGTVTGSKYLLEVNDKKILIDCGMFQGNRSLRVRNWEPLSFNPKDLSAVILTHAHIDHTGFLPKLVRFGFDKEVYSTPPTFDILKVLLIDAAHIQEEEAAYRNKKKISRHKPALPLFSTEDAVNTIKLGHGIHYNKWHTISKEFKFRFINAGHILGASSVQIVMNDGESEKSILFSGDVGKYAIALVSDPSVPPESDYIVCESTYGGKFHPAVDPFFEFDQLLKRIIKEKRILLIPAFAIGRTQQIVYMAHVLMKQGEIPPIDIHIDSPMAVRATNIYKAYPEYHSIDEKFLVGKNNSFYGKSVTLHRKRKSSKMLNKLKGPAIIISASGMLTGGRIMHHLTNRLPDPNTTLALVGFMVSGSLGRRIMDGEKNILVYKKPIHINAEVVQLEGLSGHADSYEILHWLEQVKKKPKKIFITHGEKSRSVAMAEQFKKERNWNCEIPELDESFEL
ncbi:MAG: MBL fold metallo-hydrolase [Candidatus Zixiibacteriota bacterium]|nr:MAG: MBL fold metallo-hydrolase [candidate division Zixibacteria bacterium]